MGESQRMTYTEDFVRSAMANYFILEARIREVAIAVETLRGGTRNASEDYTSFEFYEGSLIVKFEYYCCGGTEYDQFELPIEYLWLENFEEVEKTRLEAAKEAARLAEEA